MSRSCKCAVTGEIGTTDTFVKIGNRYYKSQEVYDKDKENKKYYKELIDYICKEFLGYEDNKKFSTLLPKELKRFSAYDNYIILETVKRSAEDIRYWIHNHDSVSQDNIVLYIIKVIQSNINDIEAAVQYENRQKKKQNNVTMDVDNFDFSTIGTKAKGNDISRFLNDDDF